MDIRPTRGKILGKVLPESTEQSGFTLVKLGKQIPSRINVVSIGATKITKKGKQEKACVYIGDIAYIKRYSGLECTISGNKFAFVKNEDIIARENEKGIHAVRDSILATVEHAENIQTIIIPDQAKRYSGDFWGRVVAVGPDYKHQVSVGDKIHFERNEGIKISYDGKELVSLKHRWVVGVERD